MAEKGKTGILEVIAIAALLLFIWKQTHKKKALDVKKVEPKPVDYNAELGGEGFDLNAYCKNIVYRPLSSENLVTDDLIGLGWCAKGDTTMIDKSKGFGDDYADVQAKNYEQMKADEAAYLKDKYFIHFRLINSTSSKITTNILNTTQDSSIFTAPLSPSLSAPVASAASGVSNTGFTANWAAATGALGYYLDVAYDVLFTSMVPGYNNKIVGLVLSAAVTPIGSGTDYYYRVRSYDMNGVSANSNIINARTQTVYNDYFLPSLNELSNMYLNLYLLGAGGFASAAYYCSTESGGNIAIAFDFASAIGVAIAKGTPERVRACRSFITPTGTYAIGSTGPAGGLVFTVVVNGDGTDTVYEAATTDLNSVWSNITSVAIGTTVATLGRGKQNTLDIIGQVGHVTSAAKLCKDLIVIA